jgi:hypothetical protein
MTIKLLTCNYVVFITGFWQFCRKSVANIRIIPFQILEHVSADFCLKTHDFQ